MTPADRQWELAGLARQDGDHEAERKHTAEARRLMGYVSRPAQADPKWYCDSCKGHGCRQCNGNGLDPAKFFAWSQ
jgi:hypothetical protein